MAENSTTAAKSTKKTRGRTTKTASKRKAEAEKKKLEKALDTLKEIDRCPVEELPKYYYCVRCGKRTKRADGVFLKSINNTLFDGNDGYIHVCTDCINDLYDRLYKIYREKRIAMMILCGITDMFFSDVLFEQMYFRDDFSPGKYFRALNLQHNKDKTFTDFLIPLFQKNSREITEVRDDISRGWKASEQKNKASIDKAMGYDPFQNKNYEPDDLRFLYNTAASYLTDDIQQDSHKMQQVIVMTKMYLDVEKLDETRTPRLGIAEGDPVTTKTYIDARNSIVAQIGKIASENGFSNKQNKNTNTLTSIMRDMLNAEIEEAKVNVIQSKISKSYEEISKFNAKALIDELNLTQDDYARIVATQSELVASLQKQVEELTERLRLTNIRLKASEKEKEELQIKLSRKITEYDDDKPTEQA